MVTIDPDVTLAAIVNARPDAARVLERYGLDYCCGGRRPLVDACRERDLDPIAVIARLDAETAGAPADWPTLDAAALADHIEATHHAYLHEELPRLSELAARVRRVHEARHPELVTVESVFDALRAELEPHLVKEEWVLFPMIRELAAATTLPKLHCGSVRNPVSAMMREHDAAGDLLSWLRAETADYTPPPDACDSYRVLYRDLEALEEDTHLHVHKENNVLFPLVEQIEADLEGRA